MTENQNERDETYERDSWLTSVFAAAAGPFVDTAFAERILKRLRRQERVRTLVIFGTVLFAAAITLWQAAGFIGPLPTVDMGLLKAPEWLANTRTSIALAGVTAAAFAIWMVAEEA
ncbi:MAG: hypothetical protein GKS03_07305 [Alphaproteobacteria bacterium]|nr:hypothetical protein [Alphaproteobacteria bacterium]